jgi:iron complex transport system ATP-binding protein
MTPPILEFQNLSFCRGERTILERLSFSVACQEMIALIGPNGAGKTTLLKLICRLLRPTSGTVLFDGRPLGSWNRQELSRSVALIPQELHIPFNFSVEEVVAQGRVPHLRMFGSPSPRDAEIVGEAMDAVDVLNLRHRMYSQLSGGERQRVKIAIALAQQPKLMLLDEPTQHLDIGRQIELVRLLRSLNDRGITILAAMHDLNLVSTNFTSAILLSPEPSWLAGPVSELLRHDVLERAFSVDRSSLANYFHTSQSALSLREGLRLGIRVRSCEG